MLAEFMAAMLNEFKIGQWIDVLFFGIEVKQKQDGIFISQKKNMKEILEKFKMSNCNPVNTPIAMKIKLSRERN